jgi:copper chaperone
MSRVKLMIEDMTCGGCVRGVTRAIQAIDPAAMVAADLAARSIEVSTSRSEAEIRAVLRQAGYAAAA